VAWRGICAPICGSKAELGAPLSARTWAQGTKRDEWVATFEVPSYAEGAVSYVVERCSSSAGRRTVIRLWNTYERAARVLESPARVRVVARCARSGKTWLVAEVLVKSSASAEQDKWIAALSFTRLRR